MTPEEYYINFAKTDFNCPHCEKLYKDENDKYFNRINKNKTWVTKVKCSCDKQFYLTVNYQGDFQTFKK